MTFPGAPAAPEAPETTTPPPEGGTGDGAAAPQDDGGQSAAPAGADPRVLEQMQAQLQQFGGVVGQMAEHLPAIQQLAQSQQGQGTPEPTIEELAAQFFGGQDPNQGQPLYDPYTGEPVQPQQQQGQQPQGDPNQLIDLFRQVVRSEVAPVQQRLQREDQQRAQQEWDSLYKEFPQMQDPAQAPQIAERIAQAAMLFATSPDEATRFAQNAQFVRMVHLSSVNEQRGQGETPATPGDGTSAIEAASGASAPGQAAVDEGDAIVAAGRGGGGGAGSHFR